MRAAYDALDAETKMEIEDLVCEHSPIYSRQRIGFFDLTEEERVRFAPVRQRLVRTHPSTGRKSISLSWHAGGSKAGPCPKRAASSKDLVEFATQRQFVYAHCVAAISSCGTTAARCTGRGRFPRTSRATCAARRS